MRINYSRFFILIWLIMILTTLWWPKNDFQCFTCEGDEIRFLYSLSQLESGAPVDETEMGLWWWSHKYGMAGLHQLLGTSSMLEYSIVSRLLTTLAILMTVFTASRLARWGGLATLFFITVAFGHDEIWRMFRMGLIIKPFVLLSASLVVLTIFFNERIRSGWDFIGLFIITAACVMVRPNLGMVAGPAFLAIALARPDSIKSVPSYLTTLMTAPMRLPGIGHRAGFAMVGLAAVLIAYLSVNIIPNLTPFAEEKSPASLKNLYGSAGEPGIMGMLDFIAPRIWQQVTGPFTDGFYGNTFLRREFWDGWSLFGPPMLFVTVSGLAAICAGAIMAIGRLQMISLAIVGTVAAQALAALLDIYPIGLLRYGFHFLPLLCVGLGLWWAIGLERLIKYLKLQKNRVVVPLIGTLALFLATGAASQSVYQVWSVTEKFQNVKRQSARVLSAIAETPGDMIIIADLHGILRLQLHGVLDNGQPRVRGNLRGHYGQSLSNAEFTVGPDLSPNTYLLVMDSIQHNEQDQPLAQFLRQKCNSGIKIAVLTRHRLHAVNRKASMAIKKVYTLDSDHKSRYLHFSIWHPTSCDSPN